MDRRGVFFTTRAIGMVLPLCLLVPISLARAQSNADLADFFADIPDSEPSPATVDQQSVTSIHDDAEHLMTTPKVKKFLGWGPYAKHFKAICGAITADGRAHELRHLVEEYLLRPEVCPACLPLAKNLAKACKPKRIKVSPRERRKEMKHEDSARVEAAHSEEGAHEQDKKPVITTSTSSHLPRQREPRIEAVRAAIELMRQLESDFQRRELGEQALRALVARLRGNQREEREPGTQDYFAALADILEMPRQKISPTTDTQEESNSTIEAGRQFGENIHIGGGDSEDINELFE